MSNCQAETLRFFAEITEMVLARGRAFFTTLDGVSEGPLPEGMWILIKGIWGPAIESIAVSILKAATSGAEGIGVSKEVLSERTNINCSKLGLEAEDAEQILDLVLAVIFEDTLLYSPRDLDINGTVYRLRKDEHKLLFATAL